MQFWGGQGYCSLSKNSKYYLGWNRSPAQVGCMRQVLGPGALGRPRGIGWRGMWEGGSIWGTHVYPRLIHVNVWQKPLQCCKVISLQLIKNKYINKKELKKTFLYRQGIPDFRDKASVEPIQKKHSCCLGFLVIQPKHWQLVFIFFLTGSNVNNFIKVALIKNWTAFAQNNGVSLSLPASIPIAHFSSLLINALCHTIIFPQNRVPSCALQTYSDILSPQ